MEVLNQWLTIHTKVENKLEWLGLAAMGRIEGSFYNVMGFPVHRVWELLKEFE